MSETDQGEEQFIPVSSDLWNGPIDYNFLKSEIQEKGPIREYHPATGLEGFLNITPCLCGLEGCDEDVISITIKHGIVSFRSLIEKEDLMSNESLSSVFHNFFHYPECFYSSSSDEQQIEIEVFDKLGINPFTIYMAEDGLEEITKQLSESDAVSANFWQSHNLLPLLRILDIKRKFKQWAKNDAEDVSGEDCEQLISDVFDVGFLAGRLWSEYRTKENLEAIVDKGEASIRSC